MVGSINMDVTLEIRRPPSPGETLLAEGIRWGPGGKGANQAVAASRLGVATSFVGSVGNDPFGSMLRDALVAEGVDLSALHTVEGTPSGLAVIQEARGESTILVAAGANACLTVEALSCLPEDVFARAFLAVQLEIPHPTALSAMERVRRHRGMVLLDPSPAEAVGRDLIAAADIVLPNRSEAAVITGLPVDDRAGAEEAGRALLGMGAKAAIVKLDADGAVLVRKEGSVFIPPLPVRTVDATAAGDAFLAGCISGLSRSMDLADAARLGAQVAAIAVSRPGAMSSLPRVRDLGALTPPGGSL